MLLVFCICALADGNMPAFPKGRPTQVDLRCTLWTWSGLCRRRNRTNCFICPCLRLCLRVSL